MNNTKLIGNIENNETPTLRIFIYSFNHTLTPEQLSQVFDDKIPLEILTPEQIKIYEQALNIDLEFSRLQYRNKFEWVLLNWD